MLIPITFCIDKQHTFGLFLDFEDFAARLTLNTLLIDTLYQSIFLDGKRRLLAFLNGWIRIGPIAERQSGCLGVPRTEASQDKARRKQKSTRAHRYISPKLLPVPDWVGTAIVDAAAGCDVSCWTTTGVEVWPWARLSAEPKAEFWTWL